MAFKTARALSELFGIWNSQLIGRYKEMTPGESYDIPPPPTPQFETGQSSEWTLQCSQWELIWNSLLIGMYKEMTPGESYDIPPYKFETGRAQSHLSMQSMKLIWNSQLIARWIIIPPTPTPPVWNWQSSEWNLCFSMQSMRAHLKLPEHWVNSLAFETVN